MMGSIYRQEGRSIWWVKYKAAGRWQAESSRSDKREDAVRLLKLREGDNARGIPVTANVGRYRFEEAVTALVNYHKARDRNTKKMERRIAMHLAPVFAGWRMSEITVADTEAYLVRRKESGAATATINRELGLLKQMFSVAVRAGKLMVKPSIQLPAERNARQGFLEHDQYQSVLRCLPEELRPLVTVAYYTGWRIKSELLPMEWRQVDRVHGHLRLEPNTTKNKEGRTFPYASIPELRDAIEGQWQERERLKDEGRIIPFVFHRDGLRIRSMLKAFKKACKDAGCPGRLPHDLRRSAVRNLERVGVPRSVAMKLTGHLTESVYRRYAIVSEGDLETASRKLAMVTSVVASTGKT
jgi:integrase